MRYPDFYSQVWTCWSCVSVSFWRSSAWWSYNRDDLMWLGNLPAIHTVHRQIDRGDGRQKRNLAKDKLGGRYMSRKIKLIDIYLHKHQCVSADTNSWQLIIFLPGHKTVDMQEYSKEMYPVWAKHEFTIFLNKILYNIPVPISPEHKYHCCNIIVDANKLIKIF